MKRFLIIQTAFIGDAILATSLLESLHNKFPDAKIDLVVRKGNESLFTDHPFLNQLFIWDKKNGKYKQLFKTIKEIRKNKYDRAICLQRYLSGSIILIRSKANEKFGFKKNPLSLLFTKSFDHNWGNGTHEIERNHSLISDLCESNNSKPKLHITYTISNNTSIYKNHKYICIAPTSVWKTKEVPEEKWIKLIDQRSEKVYLLGAPNDAKRCRELKSKCSNQNIEVLAGKLNFLESASLMKDAEMNYVNDSAPLHLCSAVNAPVTAFFCSTTESFGFGPLSDNSKVIEVKNLDCKPCGMHGHKECPKGHFKCGFELEVQGL